MSKAKVVIIACANVMFYLGLTVLLAGAQGCPAVGQINGLNGRPNAGLQNGAHATIQVVGSTLQAGDAMVRAAANNWMTIQSATFTFNILDVNSVQSGTASATNPIIIFQIGPASDFAPGAGCAGAFMCTQASSLDAAGHVVIGQIELNPANTTNNLFFQRAFDHELGHCAFGLGDCTNCDNAVSIMASPVSSQTDIGPQPCDQNYVFQNSGGAYGSDPTPPPNNPPVDPGGGGPGGLGSPIIIDTEGEGFHLTSAIDGVTFDISGTGHPVQIAWTNPHFHNAFLALPGPDGLVHNGKELFGNFTPQPLSDHPNGFIALAQYDRPEKGGNGDGIIDDRDAVFSRLRLWIDENHDGVCQPSELHRLSELGIYSLGLHYEESRRADQFGNQFRYKARVNPTERRDFRDERQHGEESEVGRWAYDVFFVTK